MIIYKVITEVETRGIQEPYEKVSCSNEVRNPNGHSMMYNVKDNPVGNFCIA